MKRNQGFTLIELLAVIIILAVIALIATPIILNVVEKSKEESRRNSIFNYADGVRLTYMENILLGSNINEIDFKNLTNNKMNNKTVDCEIVSYCEKTGAVLSNCSVSNKGEYYFANGVLVTTRPSNMDDVLACNALLIGDSPTEEKPQIDYEKPNYTCDTNCDDSGIAENVIDKNSDNEYTVYTVGYTTHTDLKKIEYNINIKIPFDTSKYTLKVVSSEVMSTVEDFVKYRELKDKGVISGSGSDGNDAVATPQEFKDHSATANEIIINSIIPSCNESQCTINIKESYQNLNNIIPHDTTTKNGNNILAIYLPIKIKLELAVKEDTNLITTLLKQYNDTNTVGLLKDGNNYYYKGTNSEVANNFVWYEGHLWRVVQINDDNTVTMVTQQPITTIQPSTSPWTTEQQYKDSYINTWLNNVFYNSISDKSKIKQSTFNVGIYNNVSEITSTQYVGLLDGAQYTRAGLANSFLDIKDSFLLGNRYSSTSVGLVYYSGKLTGNSLTYAYGSRPVIKIFDLTITSGNGTLSDPFRETKTSTNTSNIKVGEYISVPGNSSYCGSDARCLFRVVSKDSNSVKVILNGLLPTTSAFGSTTTFSNISTIYTPLINFADSISTTYGYSENKTFNIGMYGYGANYTVVSNTTYSGNVGLPVAGEMFSGNDIDLSGTTTKTFVNSATIENPTISSAFWTMNAHSSTNVNSVNDHGFFSIFDPLRAYGIRPVLYLNLGTSSYLTFTKGEGTAERPYVLGN